MNENQIPEIVSRVKIIYPSQRPELSSNGGEYIFVEIYDRIATTDQWEVHYRTSADFEYCEVYGKFERCNSCSEWDGGCVAKSIVLTNQELITVLDAAEKEEAFIEIAI